MKDWIYNHTFLSSMIGSGLLLIIFFIIDLVLDSKGTYIQYNALNLQSFVLAATLTAIVWYSLETRLLKNATNIANAIQAEPFLVLQYRKKDNKDELYIENYGKGSAFNIKIEIENIQGLFNFSVPNPNPMKYEDEKVLIENNQIINQNIETEITLLFDKSEGDKIVGRKRKYKVQKVADGWHISFLG